MGRSVEEGRELYDLAESFRIVFCISVPGVIIA
jgi:hypothetical protein